MQKMVIERGWYDDRNGFRWFVACKDATEINWIIYNENLNYYLVDKYGWTLDGGVPLLAKHLPDCDGWDWKEIKWREPRYSDDIAPGRIPVMCQVLTNSGWKEAIFIQCFGDSCDVKIGFAAIANFIKSNVRIEDE